MGLLILRSASEKYHIVLLDFFHEKDEIRYSFLWALNSNLFRCYNQKYYIVLGNDIYIYSFIFKLYRIYMDIQGVSKEDVGLDRLV